MKDHCLEIEPLLALYAEEALEPAAQVRVTRHLDGCQACRAAVEAQRGVRDLLAARAGQLRTRASEDLRDRVAASLHASRPRPARSPLRLPVAATVLLAVLVAGGIGLTGTSTTVLAAQLALDHLKCVRIVQGAADHGIDPSLAGEEWERTYKGPLVLPAGPAADRASLIGVRRCLYGHGHLAHLLYNVNGRIVSLFVMPRDDHDASSQATLREVFGHQARVWSAGDQTFALVSDADLAGLDRLEQTFRGE